MYFHKKILTLLRFDQRIGRAATRHKTTRNKGREGRTNETDKRNLQFSTEILHSFFFLFPVLLLLLLRFDSTTHTPLDIIK